MPERPQTSRSRDLGRRHYRNVAEIDQHIAELTVAMETDKNPALLRDAIEDLQRLKIFYLLGAMGRHGMPKSHGRRVR